MNNNENIYNFLKSNGFIQIEKNTSEFFGDFFDIFKNDIFQLRFSSSKSFQTVDICHNRQKEIWYDLALVKALIYNEKNLNLVTTIVEHSNFLQKELAKISELFSDNIYQTTKRRLEDLENNRANQMFPKLKT